MLKLHLITIGDTPRGPFYELKEHYLKQLRPYVDVKYTVLKSETDILKRISNEHFFIVLDAAGKDLDTLQFAGKIRQLEDEGTHVTILLGGAKGLPQEIKEEADMSLSLSPMTTTHDIAHIFFLEQLYRAATINRGKTYNY